MENLQRENFKTAAIIRHLFLILLLFPGSVLSAQNHTVSGYVADSKSGETLIGASVYDSISKRSVLTNPYGYYSLNLPKGNVNIRYLSAGNAPQSKKFTLSNDTVINISMSEIIELQEVVVTSYRTDIGVKGSLMSTIDVPVAQIKNIPPMMGEVDVIKALQLLPGVQSGSEGSAGLYVRGGGPDENLMLLDGMPLYNVNHMFGFFSVFNADAVKSITLYKGSFPARFGGRLSSVVDVRTNDGNMKSYHGSASIGLLSAKINVEGPIWKDRTSFFVSGRRSYFDILMQPLMPLLLPKEGNDDGISLGGKGNSTGYYFYDVNAKINHKFSDKDRLYVSFYMGDDVIYANLKEINRSHTSESDFTQIKWVTNSKDKTKMNWAWGNILTTLRWNHVFNSKLFANTTLAYSQYKFYIDVNTTGTTQRVAENNPDFVYYSSQNDIGLGYKSNIYDWSARMDFDWNPHFRHEIKFGGLYTYHTFAPGVSVMQMNMETELNIPDTNPVIVQIDTIIQDPNILAHEMQLYFEDNYSINRHLKVNFGLNYSLYSVKHKTYHDLQPRTSLRVLINDNISAKVAYSYMSQYIHLLSNSSLSMPSDLWVPATQRIKPMKSHQIAAGVFYNLLKQADISVEGYYKTMNNVLEFKEGASFLGSASSWEDKVYQGRGWSYGVEFLLQRSVGKLTGWIGYTWSRTERRFDKPGQIINEGKTFFAKYDRRHDLSITVSYAITKNIDISSTFVFGTGYCGTLPLHVYQASLPRREIYDPLLQSPFLPDGWDNRSLDYIPTRNNYRLPNYHRLDIGANFHKKLKKFGSQTWNVSIYNVYNRLNPFLVYTGYENNKNVLKQMSLFPIMPSVSYTFRF